MIQGALVIARPEERCSLLGPLLVLGCRCFSATCFVLIQVEAGMPVRESGHRSATNPTYLPLIISYSDKPRAFELQSIFVPAEKNLFQQ
jgi:hypothetical protein